jgi:hypothetical protein
MLQSCLKENISRWGRNEGDHKDESLKGKNYMCYFVCDVFSCTVDFLTTVLRLQKWSVK